MSFFDDASLVFLPSGEAGKDGKAYSMKPTDGSGDFTFSRGSNLTATRVDSNGLIEKGRENLLTQSNNFSSNPPWGSTSISFTSGENGYDGSSDAWIIERTDVNAHIRQTPPLGNVMTFSIFAKANTLNWVRIRTGSVQNAYFNLDPNYSGSRIGFTQNVIDATITDIGNGWFRCIATAIGYDRFYIYPAVDNNDVSGTSGSIYIQDAQLEQGLVATEYIESGASTGLAGILEDSPRFDYSGGASCPSLLLEPSRTNLVKHSEYIGSLYSEVGTSVTDNATQSPNGTNEAALIYEDLVNNSHWVQTDVTTSSSTTYTQSAFVKKKDSGIYASLRTNGVGANSYIIFDFDTATIVDEGSDIISSGVVDYSNGWYRIYMTYTKATISFIAGITNSTTNPIPSYLGTGKGYYLWGAQLEEGSYPTSYIPNHSGGSVTRNEETARGLFNGDSIFDRDWTAFCELVVPNVGGDLTGAGFVLKSVEGSTSTADRVAVLVHESNSQLELIFYDGTTQQQIPFNYTFGDTLKIAIRNDSAYFINGTKYTTTMVLQEPVEVAYGRAGQADSSVGETANIKQTLVFPSALSDSECITLTS